MKRIYKFLGIGATALLSLGFASCSNDLDAIQRGPENSLPGQKLALAPDFVAWTGDKVIGSTLPGTRAGDTEGNDDTVIKGLETGEWQSTTGGEISWVSVTSDMIDKDFEEQYVDNKLPEYSNNFEALGDIDLDRIFWAKGEDITFELYPVFNQTSHWPKNIGIFWYDNSGEKQEQVIWSDLNGYNRYVQGGYWDQEKEEYITTYTYYGLKVTVKQGYKFGFFWDGKYNINHDGKQGDDDALIRYYTSPELNPELTITNESGAIVEPQTKTRFHAGIFNGNGRTYIGFEDWTDFDFQDFVFTSNIKLATTTSDDTTFDGQEYPEDTEKVCPECGHKGHDHKITNCEECKNAKEEGQDHPCYPDEVTENPSEPSAPKLTDNEVEINLALNDIHTLPGGEYKYDIADLVTKLSLHVRYPHDVEVILPVPERFYCDQDDLYILKTHNEGDFTYGGEENFITYQISDAANNRSWTVKLAVQFVGQANDNLTAAGEGYIRVYTEGITPELINYLKENYGDGINFEVYNYYNRGTMGLEGTFDEISYHELQYKYLSHAFVNFDWNESGAKVLPENYINAFNTLNDLPNPGDCYTWIIGDNHANVDNVYKSSGAVVAGSNANVTWGGDERAFFSNPYQGPHYNVGELNWIYTLKTIDDTNYDEMPNPVWPFNDANGYWQSVRFNGNSDFRCTGLVGW